MAGLVGYMSSDDEAEDNRPTLEPTIQVDSHNGHKTSENGVRTTIGDPSARSIPREESLPSGPPIGPTAGPFGSDELQAASTPSSPYTINRSNIHNLTLPTAPNMNIPPSPPGSPAPGVDARVNHFLELKKRGVHFNAKLAASTALKNPRLLPKLMDGIGLDYERDQYATTLPEDLWSHEQFPSWAFKEELAKSQLEMGKKKDAERKGRERQFEPAAVKETSTDSINARNSSAAERVMAGLEKRA